MEPLKTFFMVCFSPAEMPGRWSYTITGPWWKANYFTNLPDTMEPLPPDLKTWKSFHHRVFSQICLTLFCSIISQELRGFIHHHLSHTATWCPDCKHQTEGRELLWPQKVFWRLLADDVSSHGSFDRIFYCFVEYILMFSEFIFLLLRINLYLFCVPAAISMIQSWILLRFYLILLFLNSSNAGKVIWT